MKIKILTLVSISLFSFYSKNAQAQLSAGASLGYHVNSRVDPQFDNSFGLAIQVAYTYHFVRFGTNLTFVNDMKLDSDWALTNFNQDEVENNSAKIDYKPVAALNIQMNTLHALEKVNLFVGTEVAFINYKEEGTIRMQSNNRETNITLENVEVRDYTVYLRSTFEYKVNEDVDLFGDVAVPFVSESGNALFNVRFGLWFHLIKQ